MIPQELTDKLEKLLAERRESDGGYAPVTHKDMEQLYEVMYAVVAAKWGADPDGDRPINFQIIDRTRFEPQHFQTIPYRHHAEGFKNEQAREAWKAEILSACISNVKTAADRLDSESRIEDHYRFEAQRANATYKDGDSFVCVNVNPEDEDNLTVGKDYEADNHSWWSGDVEMVRVKLDDQDERWNCYPVSCFLRNPVLPPDDTAKPA